MITTKTTALQKRLKLSKTVSSRGFERREIKIKGLAGSNASSLQKAYEGTLSPKAAIAAKCRDCVGYEDTVDRIRTCESYTCPIWAYRPYAK